MLSVRLYGLLNSRDGCLPLVRTVYITRGFSQLRVTISAFQGAEAGVLTKKTLLVRHTWLSYNTSIKVCNLIVLGIAAEFCSDHHCLICVCAHSHSSVCV